MGFPHRHDLYKISGVNKEVDGYNKMLQKQMKVLIIWK